MDFKIRCSECDEVIETYYNIHPDDNMVKTGFFVRPHECRKVKVGKVYYVKGKAAVEVLEIVGKKALVKYLNPSKKSLVNGIQRDIKRGEIVWRFSSSLYSKPKQTKGVGHYN